MKIAGIMIGILTGILGVCAFAMPIRTFLSLGWILGITLLLNGTEMAVAGFSEKKKDVWKIVLGVIVFIGGILILFNGAQRLMTDVMLAMLIGICIIASGVNQIISGVKQWKVKKSTAILFAVCGVISVIMGILSVNHPLLTMLSVGYIIGASLLMQGINMVILMCTYKKE